MDAELKTLPVGLDSIFEPHEVNKGCLGSSIPRRASSPVKVRSESPYEVFVKLDSYAPCKHAGVHTLFRKGMLCHVKTIQAKNRGEAVKRALNWYWLTYRGKRPAFEVVQVDDPYDEVAFYPEFRCHDFKNNYLPDDVAARVIQESNGKLERDAKLYKVGRPPATLRWRKKRGKMEETISNSRTCRRRRPPPIKRIAPSVYQDYQGRLWYFIASQRQQIAQPFVRHKKVRKFISRRKKKFIRLYAQNLRDAAAEIRDRKLLEMNQSARSQKQYAALLQFVDHLAWV